MQIVYFLEQRGKTQQYLVYLMQLSMMQEMMYHLIYKVILKALHFTWNTK